MRTAALFFLLLLSATKALAIKPETGWWWNSNEPGRGFSIEVQNNTIFFSGYLYEPNGAPVWYAAAGTYNHQTSTVSAPLLAFSGGQCMTCPFRPNTQQPSPGNLTLTFSTPTAGTLTWPGGSIPITRFIYGTTFDHRRLAGGWIFTTRFQTLTDADWIAFGAVLSSNGDEYMAGINHADRAVVGDAINGTYSVLIDSSTSFWDLYVCPANTAGVESMSCLEFLYAKGSNPSGSGNLGYGFKFVPASTGIAPEAPAAGIKASHRDAMREELRRAAPIALRESAAAQK